MKGFTIYLMLRGFTGIPFARSPHFICSNSRNSTGMKATQMQTISPASRGLTLNIFNGAQNVSTAFASCVEFTTRLKLCVMLQMRTSLTNTKTASCQGPAIRFIRPAMIIKGVAPRTYKNALLGESRVKIIMQILNSANMTNIQPETKNTPSV
jgi:hypothetical protein